MASVCCQRRLLCLKMREPVRFAGLMLRSVDCGADALVLHDSEPETLCLATAFVIALVTFFVMFFGADCLPAAALDDLALVCCALVIATPGTATATAGTAAAAAAPETHKSPYITSNHKATPTSI